MAYSPFAKSITISVEDDYNVSDSMLEAIAEALDMEVRELTEPISYNDGTTIVTKYVVNPVNGEAFVIYQSSSGTYLYINPKRETEQGVVESGNVSRKAIVLSSSYTTLYCTNISAETKLIEYKYSSARTYGTLWTTGKTSEGVKKQISISYNTNDAPSTYLNIDLETKGTLSPTSSISSYESAHQNSNYKVLRKAEFSAYDVETDNLYYIGGIDSKEFLRGEVYEINGKKYVIVAGGRKAYAYAVEYSQ